MRHFFSSTFNNILSPFASAKKTKLCGATSFSFIAAGLNITAPFVLRTITDNLFDDADEDSNTWKVLIYVGMVAAADMLQHGANFLSVDVSSHLEKKLIASASSANNKASLTEQRHIKKTYGSDLSEQYRSVRRSVQGIIREDVIHKVPRVFQVVGISFSSYFTSNWQVGVVFSLFSIGHLWLSKWGYEKLFDKHVEIKGALNSNIASVKERFEMTSLIKQFSNENYEELLFAQRQEKIMDLRHSFEKIRMSTNVKFNVLEMIALSFVGLMTANAVLDNSTNFDLKDYITVQIFYQLLLKPLRKLKETVETVADSTRVLEKLQTMVVARPENSSPYNLSNNKKSRNIEFKKVNFCYPESKDNVVENLSFEIKAGDTIAICGFSGKGKTTIIKLLLGLYDSYSGSIEVDGTEIRRINKKSLRRNIVYVSQDTEFFAGDSLFDNIQYANLNSKKGLVNQAIIQSDLEQLSKRYGDRPVGNGPSGGEKQKIGVSRALLMSEQEEATVYIFDEPTSSLDADNKYKILQMLRNIVGDATIIIISHNLFLVQDVDRILFIDKNKTYPYRTHKEHRKLTQGYKKLWELQSASLYKDFWKKPSTSGPSFFQTMGRFLSFGQSCEEVVISMEDTGDEKKGVSPQG